MENLSVGQSGVSVNGIGLGGGKWDREVDQETSLRVMDYAVENGEVIEALDRASERWQDPLREALRPQRGGRGRSLPAARQAGRGLAPEDLNESCETTREAH